MQGQVRRQMQLNADMSAMMTERFNVSGALLAKLFGRPAEEDAEFAEKAAGVRNAGVSIALTGAFFMTALTLVAALATALTYLIGGRLAISRSITLGTLMALAALLGRLYGPLTALTNVRITVMSALVSFDRVFEVLDLEPMIKEKPDAGALPEGPVAVEFDDVAFRYPTAEEVSLASLESVARLDQAPSAQVLRGVTLHRGGGRDGRAGRARAARARPRSPRWPTASTTRWRARSASAARTSATSRWSRCTPRSAR